MRNNYLNKQTMIPKQIDIVISRMTRWPSQPKIRPRWSKLIPSNKVIEESKTGFLED